MTDFSDPELARAFIAKTAMDFINTVVGQARPVYGALGMRFPVAASSALLTIGRSGPLSQAELARALNQPHQSAAQQLASLTRAGLVEVSACPDDRRVKLHALTATGRDQFDRLQSYLIDEKHVFAELEEEIGVNLSHALRSANTALAVRSLQDRFSARREKAAS